MYQIPERGLQPPEPAAVAICPACGEYLWPGEAVWLDRWGDRQICMKHMDSDAAALHGYGQNTAHRM